MDVARILYDLLVMLCVGFATGFTVGADNERKAIERFLRKHDALRDPDVAFLVPSDLEE